jgi:hypothetical protein
VHDRAVGAMRKTIADVEGLPDPDYWVAASMESDEVVPAECEFCGVVVRYKPPLEPERPVVCFSCASAASKVWIFRLAPPIGTRFQFDVLGRAKGMEELGPLRIVDVGDEKWVCFSNMQVRWERGEPVDDDLVAIGTRHPATPRSVRHTCDQCGSDCYFSDQYPEKVTWRCIECAGLGI